MLHCSPTIKNNSYLTRQTLSDVFSRYGFVECHTMRVFLELVCDATLGECEMAYIRDKTEECLRVHDNKSDYFAELRKVAMDINYFLASQR
ncbi:hypothetical protein OI450_07870 [Pectobacterium cacticida]|uniref:Uncharacterized protein n=1 Tax=Pectobacterium cacticida TaxID=69221 RepID=A0ABZ2G891_9GAMM|nr:hypothetical protein [Pectobacterium cacticida]UYX08252.1 hypothetical protein OI450_07870 [Pectobacterium cacticida]